MLWGIESSADWATWALVAATLGIPLVGWASYVSLRLERIMTRTKGLPQLERRVARHERKLTWLRAKISTAPPRH
ncbi:MAG TPA: hypothetical protein VGG64_08905 [Pirellulales bacterium]|jgi:hypothetical protein